MIVYTEEKHCTVCGIFLIPGQNCYNEKKPGGKCKKHYKDPPTEEFKNINKIEVPDRCVMCEILLSEDNVYSENYKKLHTYHCKVCHKKIRNEVYKHDIKCRIKYLDTKEQIIDILGRSCACCGETSWPFLTI